MKKLLLPIALLQAALLSYAEESLSNESCLDCHDDPGWTEMRKGKEISMHVAPEIFAGSLHGDFDCIDCHVDIEEVPPQYPWSHEDHGERGRSHLR